MFGQRRKSMFIIRSSLQRVCYSQVQVRSLQLFVRSVPLSAHRQHMTRPVILLGMTLITTSTLCTVASSASDTSSFVESKSGLKYRDTQIGNGPHPNKGDTVKVHYTGWLDGFDGKKKFDSSLDRGVPLEFPAGIGKVIPGWDEALLSMNVGAVREVIIPPELGYGSRGAGGVIPPNATLYFRMELIDATKTGFIKGLLNKVF